MIKKCPECGSAELEEFNASVSITCGDGIAVYRSGKVTLCSGGGFGAHMMPEAALAQTATRR
jgi:hypothetical protein